MRPSRIPIILVLLLTGLAGCGKKGAKLQQSVVPPDRTLYETGQEYLGKSQYIKARLAFQTLINTYQDSELVEDSYMAMGDSFYREGGTENLLQAEDQYKNFIIFFPTSPKAADAQMKIISLNMKMMRAPDRDQNYTIRAEQAIKKLLDTFPDSEYVPIVREYLVEVQENLAQRDYMVGMFYADRGNFAGAGSRLRDIMQKYPQFSGMDEALWNLGQVLEKTENSDEAAIYYGKIAEGYPHSKFFEEAKARLSAMDKPIPMVNSQLALENQSRIKPSEGFSPLKPLVEFGKALGFIGPPDRYEQARKTIEDQKADDVAVSAGGSGTAGRGSDGILLEATIEKDASGKARPANSAAANPKEGGSSSDKKEEGKKEGSGNEPKNPEKKPPF